MAVVNLIGVDSLTGGNWIGKYGNSGYNMFYGTNNYKFKNSPWISGYANTTGKTVVADSTIAGNPWYPAIPGTANASGAVIMYDVSKNIGGGRLRFADLVPHRLSMYFACLDGIARTQTVSFYAEGISMTYLSNTISIASNVGVWCNYLYTPPYTTNFFGIQVVNSDSGVIPSMNVFAHDVYQPASIGGFNFGFVGSVAF